MAAQDTFAANALAGDHKDTAMAKARRLLNKGAQSCLGLLRVVAMQVKSRLDRQITSGKFSPCCPVETGMVAVTEVNRRGFCRG